MSIGFDWSGCCIGRLPRIAVVKERYRDYLYIEVMPEESKNAAFYQRHGFSIMPDGVAMQICNPGERR